MEEPFDVKCSRCKCYRQAIQFLKKGRQMKTCEKCRDSNERCRENIAENRKKQKEENPLRVKLCQMILNSRKEDKKKNREYNEEDFINLDFLYKIYMEQESLCFHCDGHMNLEFNKESRNKKQITIQRLNNSVAHVQSNCVFACFECNCCKKMETQ